MRLILVGTGPFGLPSFERLYASQNPVVALVTAPVRPPRGRRPPPASPVRALAREHGTRLLEPESVNAAAARADLAALEADLMVVCDYGQILSAETLASTRLGGINLHGSLLPRYRGAAPVAWAIFHGETETGVSVIHMTPRVDAGPVIAQAATPIRPDETTGRLEDRLAELGAGLVLQAVDDLAADRARALPQNPALASRAPRLRKEHGLIDWSRSAWQVRDQVRAMDPWPRAYTFWLRGAGEPLRLILGPVEPLEREHAEPGTIVEAEGPRLVVAAGEGACALGTLQPAGKKALPVEAFLRGYRVALGNRFGAP